MVFSCEFIFHPRPCYAIDDEAVKSTWKQSVRRRGGSEDSLNFYAVIPKNLPSWGISWILFQRHTHVYVQHKHTLSYVIFLWNITLKNDSC